MLRLDDAALREAGVSGPAVEIAGLTADSRRVAPGFLFVALPGAQTDGARFAADAVARGAVAVLGAEAPPGVAQLRADDPRRALALLAARFHGFAQPASVVAVTGTNGKTSTAEFARQLFALAGHRAASLGTLGLVAEGHPRGAGLTTPEPAALHAALASLAESGVTHLAMEASSHGLDQRRLDGVRLAAAGFTNLTRDHLDYHATMAGYREAKLRLFATLLPEGAAAVVHAALEAETLTQVRGICTRRHLGLIEVGREVALSGWRALPAGQAMQVSAFGERAEVELAVPGRFQAENALVALGLCVAAGLAPARALALLPRLVAVRGRMELAARLPNGAAAYVDYAHTPDALERLLEALRPHVGAGARLHVLFGAGGERDPGKRPLMGQAAARHADRVWVTDDNPRGEDPAAIRRAVLAGAGGAAVDAGAREAAIARALGALGPGDVLAVAGKGHESGQEIGGTLLPFDDAEVLRRLAGEGAAA